MRCPHCGSQKLQVVDSRDAPDAVRRRRECHNGHRFTTYERREVFTCPRCGAEDSRIERVELTATGVQRHRRCLACDLIYDTEERLARTDVAVIKTDGRREAFSRGKLFQSLQAATTKRPVPAERLLEVVDGIEAELFDSGRGEVPSSVIARMVMDQLRSLDEVAYVRYASSYLEEGGIEEMREVVEDTLQRRELEAIRKTNLPLVPEDVEPTG